MQQVLNSRAGVAVRELLSEARLIGDGNIRVTGCCGVAKECQPGDIFVAILSANEDGHEEVQLAVENGAIAVVAERFLPLQVPSLLVEDSRQAYGKICHTLTGNPTRRMRVVGVTGTNGKTVTSLLMASVLKAAGDSVGYTTSVGYCDGIESAKPAARIPSVPTMADWMTRTWANGCKSAVIEASSEALAERRLSGVELDAAIFTTLRSDHIDFHGSVLNYRRAKQLLLDQLKGDGFAVFNADDPGTRKLISKASCPAITYGMRNAGEIMATVLDRQTSEQTFLLRAGQDSVPIQTRIIGDQHIYNCLAVASAGLVLGLDLMDIARGIENLQTIPGRLERIECGQDFSAFVDVANTPDTLTCALRAIRQATRGRVICVYGSGEEGDTAIRPLLGRSAERNSDVSVITSNNPGYQEPKKIAHDIIDGYAKAKTARMIPNRLEAIDWALAQARPGDSVLIAGKGDENWQLLGSKSLEFDDRESVRQWLYNAPSNHPATIPFSASPFG
ncbi:MAG: UDP-N-acetylmuramoyl-L-alanyl-D-glutamate--2,6-diaminopimelate ligase [Pirellulaceae bacterium]|jgi:UDP-N-acetylmuramoyl-L-alanyl-D-glutamate--2,6-diaminopimelate ligase